MIWHSALPFALLSAVVVAHSGHHVENQEPFSQERLEELERKWGIDVSTPILHQNQKLMEFIVGILGRINLRPPPTYSLSHNPTN